MIWREVEHRLVLVHTGTHSGLFE
ncbi:MAG: hypothetical protein HQL65_07575 [Magnetococcales bacterium]|nr:hypothetical protein [Magnetococcales bacterium]